MFYSSDILARTFIVYLSRFRSLLLLILFGVFSFLGAGLNERTRTPLGAHQRRI